MDLNLTLLVAWEKGFWPSTTATQTVPKFYSWRTRPNIEQLQKNVKLMD